MFRPERRPAPLALASTTSATGDTVVSDSEKGLNRDAQMYAEMHPKRIAGTTEVVGFLLCFFGLLFFFFGLMYL
jgi:hypothetical protein